jgi:hypothetical protein
VRARREGSGDKRAKEKGQKTMSKRRRRRG